VKLSEEIFKKEKFPYVKGAMFSNVVGYEPSAVELFMEDVAVKVEKLENENEQLREKLKINDEEKELRGSVSPPSVQSTDNKMPKVDIMEAEEVSGMKEDIKKKLKQIETLERSYKRMIYIAETEAEEIKEESRKEAQMLLKEAHEKADILVREANNRFLEREREMHVLNSKADELKERLKNVAKFIEDAVS
jgi:cell division septum initiation protein DivIVA